MAVRRIRRDEGLRATIVRSRPLVDPRTGERVGAASAAVLQRGRLFCVQDDALSAVWIDPVTLSIETVVLQGRGQRLPKKKKADFEAAFATTEGTIFVLGSGGTERRRSVVRYDPRDESVEVTDATALHEALAARLGRAPNIEGAAMLEGDVVRLFHRANGKAAGHNASFDVRLDALRSGEGAILDEALYDLGTVALDAAADAPQNEEPTEIALTFTDATRLPDGRILFLAGAEDCADAVADGPVLGAAIGLLEGEGGRYAMLAEEDGSLSHRKIEGVAVLPGGREAFVVTDPDDVERASELCTVVLEGRW